MAIKQLAKDKFEIRLWYRLDGKRKKKTEIVHGTQRKAQAREAELKLELRDRGTLRREKPKEIPSFEAYAWEWFDVWVTRHNKASEQDTKRSTLLRHLIPAFGRYRIDEITPFQVERFKGRQIDAGYAEASVRIHLSCLSRALRCAVGWKLIDENPVANVELPVAKNCRELFLDEDEIVTFLAAVPDRWRPVFIVAIRTGMRQGEILALRWEDVDLKRGVIHVRHSLYKGELDSPKTKTSARRIPITAMDLEAAFWARSFARRGDFVFHDGQGIPLRREALRKPFRQAVIESGIGKPITFHDLRHTFGSICAMRGMDLATLQGMLGHADLRMVMRYVHTTQKHERAAMERVWNPQINS